MPKRRRTFPGWTLTEHACRACQGRILRREQAPNRKTGEAMVEVVCSVCEISAIGPNVTHRDICCCGAGRKAWNAKMRCTRQENPTPTFPAVMSGMSGF